MRLAVIDCGTNTFNLLIVDIKNNKTFSKVFSKRFPVKLGEGTINQGFISTQAVQRALEAIAAFNILINEYKVQKTTAFATSAIRDATNGDQLVQKIKNDFDISLSVIDGLKEADLIFLGVKEAAELTQEISLIMDIGGGSTELILARRDLVFWKGSFTIGAARLLEQFSPSNPITESEINNINDHLFQHLQSFFEAVKTYPPTELIGSSGAFDSMIEMINSELNGEPLNDVKTAYEIDLVQYQHISRLLQRSTIEQRKNIKGLVAMRVDMIVIFCLMVDFMLNALKINKLRVSLYSLKEGAVMDFINQQQPN